MAKHHTTKRTTHLEILVAGACIVPACTDDMAVETPFAATTGGEIPSDTSEASSDRVDDSSTGEASTTGPGDGTGDACTVGSQGCACYGNDTCDSGLSCDAGVCVPGECGDTVVQSGEECDDGNDDDDDACIDCVQAFCGDGIVRTGREACDDGNAVDDDECTTSCALPTCGDGIVQVGEECDDGNAIDSDACPSTCLAAICGDTFIQEGVEACDDGNADNTDDCLDSCEAASCGDGFVQGGVEECDDANTIDTDACPSTCLPAQCGDTFVHEGVEECDDGNVEDDDACLGNCVAATCGDSFVDQANEDCDGANLGGNDCSTLGLDWTAGPIACQSDCSADTSQCIGELDNTNGNCNDSQYCLAGGSHAQQECFIDLNLPVPFTVTEVSYALPIAVAPTLASLEIYAWNGNAPGALLASEPLDPATEFSLGSHSVTLNTPVDLDTNSFCIGLRADAQFSMSRDAGSSQGNETFIEAPDCNANTFISVSFTGFTGNWCITPTIVPG